MKKIISICMLCLFMVIGSNAANTKPVLKNTETKKIVKVITVTEDKIGEEVAKYVEIFKATFPLPVCWVVSQTEVPLGPDMYGNLYFEVTVEIACTIIYIN
jgi:hypothetical protein